MFLSNPFSEAFGLDIGDASIKLVRLEPPPLLSRSDSVVLREFRSVTLPPGAVVQGVIEQPEEVRKKLLILLGGEGDQRPITTPWVVADLPEPKTFLKLINIDSPPAHLTKEEVLLQVKKHLPFELDDAYIDWFATTTPGTEGASTGSQVLVGAVSRVVADSYTYLLESVGLNPLALEIEALSIVRALTFIPFSTTTGAELIIDLGKVRSSFIVFDQGNVQFTNTCSFSGDRVTAALATGLNIDSVAAEELKIMQGLYYDAPDPNYLRCVAAETKFLVEEIKKTCQFYQDHFEGARPITDIVLVGGSAYLKNIDTLLSHHLKIPTRRAETWWEAIPRSSQVELPSDSGLELFSAFGLAIRAAFHPI